MNAREENKLVRETIAFPVRYDKYQQTIWDAKGMMVCDIRGWGKIQFMKRSEERQDSIGEKIAKLLNEFEDNEKQDILNSPGPKAVTPVRKKMVCFDWD